MGVYDPESVAWFVGRRAHQRPVAAGGVDDGCGWLAVRQADEACERGAARVRSHLLVVPDAARAVTIQPPSAPMQILESEMTTSISCQLT